MKNLGSILLLLAVSAGYVAALPHNGEHHEGDGTLELPKISPAKNITNHTPHGKPHKPFHANSTSRSKSKGTGAFNAAANAVTKPNCTDKNPGGGKKIGNGGNEDPTKK